MKWNDINIKDAADGKSSDSWCANYVTTDSRDDKSSSLYIARRGESMDGHLFVEFAINNGVSAALVSQKLDGVDNNKLVFVEDGQRALEDMARYARSQIDAKYIGITGSVGKTTTKEMLKLVLSKYGHSYANARSFNNHVGLPLTLVNAPEDADYIITEMGMNNMGEISALSEIAKPHIALINNIEPAHIGKLGSMENIALAKSEIMDGIPEGGIVILNGDSNCYEMLYNIAQNNKNVARIISFGSNEKSDVKIIMKESSSGFLEVSVSCSSNILSYKMPLHQKHFLHNTLAALSILHALHLNIGDDILKIFEDFDSLQGRSNVNKVDFHGKSVHVIDDSYNANPSSMNAALEMLMECKKVNNSSRIVAFLGDMTELGDFSEHYHKEIGEKCRELSIDKIYFIGQEMKHACETFSSSQWFASVNDVCDNIENFIEDGDCILVKGSNFMKMNKIVEKISGKTA